MPTNMLGKGCGVGERGWGKRGGAEWGEGVGWALGSWEALVGPGEGSGGWGVRRGWRVPLARGPYCPIVGWILTYLWPWAIFWECIPYHARQTPQGILISENS